MYKNKPRVRGTPVGIPDLRQTFKYFSTHYLKIDLYYYMICIVWNKNYCFFLLLFLKSCSLLRQKVHLINIQIIWEWKYVDFFPKTAPPNFLTHIKSWYLGFLSYLYFTKWNPVSVNKAAKNVVRKFYSQYYSSEVQRHLAAGVGTHDVAVLIICLESKAS